MPRSGSLRVYLGDLKVHGQLATAVQLVRVALVDGLPLGVALTLAQALQHPAARVCADVPVATPPSHAATCTLEAIRRPN